jgi:UDP-glucose-4-epimerase GalE
MKVLLTGGAGYVGSHVLQKLCDHKISTLVFDDLSSGHKEFIGNNAFFLGDISDITSVNAAFEQFKPDMVFHIAALATLSECSKRPDDCHRINVTGTRNILDAMRKHNVKHMVFASSCAVYANAKTMTALRETDEIGPISPYAASKRDCEALLREYDSQYGIRSVAFRIFNVSGAHPEARIGERHNPETHLLPLVIDTMLGRRQVIYIYGNDYATPDGTAVRDYIHVWDIAEAFYRAAKLLESGSVSHVLNLGSGLATSVYDLINAVKEQAKMNIATSLHSRREGDSAWLFADTALLEKTLQWKPEWSNMQAIIQTALRWHQNQ